jgi:Phospholipase A2-like domain
MSKYVPVEHYNWFWDSNDFGPQETILRNRFNKLYKRYSNSTATDRYLNRRPSNYQSYTKFKDSLSKLRHRLNKLRPGAYNNINDEEIDLDLLEDNIADDTVIYDARASTSGATEVGTGIIEAASGGGSTLLTSGASGSVIPVAGGLSLGLAGAVTTGLIYNKVTKTGIQVPGTNYIGPGNSINSGKPVSGADTDAKEHDIAYSNPVVNVPVVDKIAINKFRDHHIDNPLDIPAVLGDIGLTVKSTVEKHTGQLYPGNYG